MILVRQVRLKQPTTAGERFYYCWLTGKAKVGQKIVLKGDDGSVWEVDLAFNGAIQDAEPVDPESPWRMKYFDWHGE